MKFDFQHFAEEGLEERFRASVNAPENPIVYLSIDPGKSNGVCGYDKKFYQQFMLTVAATDINKFIHLFDRLQICIIEDFRLFPNKSKQQAYSDMETSRVIGRVEGWAETRPVELIKQPSSIKPTGYKWIGKKPLPKTNPLNHALDAHVHAMYWAVRNGKILASDLLAHPNQHTGPR